MNVRNLICLLLVLFSTSNNLLAQTYKIDFDLKYIEGISSNPTLGNLIALDDNHAIVNIGLALIVKLDFKTGDYIDTLDNNKVYESVQREIKSVNIYKNVEFFDESNRNQITACDGYYIQYRRIIRVDEQNFVCEVVTETINNGLISALVYLNENLQITSISVLERIHSYGVSFISKIGYFETDKEVFVQSGLNSDVRFERGTPSFYARFIKEDNFYKFDGFLDRAAHGKRNLYCPRFFSMFYNKDQPCVSNGWEIFCYSEDLSSLERKIELDIPYEEVYSTIIQVDEDKYLTTRMNLDDIGAAIGDCNIYILDKDFQEEEHLLRFSIVHSYLNSIDYLDGKLYLYLNKLMTGELMLTVIDINQKR